MRDFIISKDNRRIKDGSQIDDFEAKYGIVFPESLRKFLLSYEGHKFHEAESYYNANGGIYEVNSVLYLWQNEIGASVEAILEGHKFYNTEGFIPFIIDSGGWDFNISIKPETYGQIWVNKFDNGEDEPFVFVAKSLQEFLEGLTNED